MCQKTCGTCDKHYCSNPDCPNTILDYGGSEETGDTEDTEQDSNCQDHPDEACTTHIAGWDACSDSWFLGRCQRSCCVCTCPQNKVCENIESDHFCSQVISQCGKDASGEWIDYWISYMCQSTCNTCELNKCFTC